MGFFSFKTKIDMKFNNINLLISCLLLMCLYTSNVKADVVAKVLDESSTTEQLPNTWHSLLVTIKTKNADIDEFFAELRRNTNNQYKFLYKKEDLLEFGKITIDVENIPLNKVLSTVFASGNIGIDVWENTIKIKRLTYTLQNIESHIIKGKIVDSRTNEPLAGATIYSPRTNNGVASDKDGNFLITMKNSDEYLVSFMGYEQQRITLDGSHNNITIKLREESVELDKVVVTGIFERPRESYTGSVKTVNERELKIYKGQNLLKTLQNIDPSVNIIQDNLGGSNPNRQMEIKLRGTSSLPLSLDETNVNLAKHLNTPLVILDGFEISISELMDFNDEEIESINILKDASATSIYGSRGANGVFVIKTKDPEEGKLRVSVNAALRLEIPDLSSYNLMNANEKIALEKQLGFYDDKNPQEAIKLQNLYNTRITETLRGETDWLREPVRIGVGHNLNVKLEGGSENFRWSLNLGNNNIKGAMKGSLRNVTNGALTMIYNHKNLLFRNQVTFSKTKADNGSYGAFSEYAKLNPYFRPKDENGNLIKEWNNFGRTPIANPLATASLNIKDYNENYVFRNLFSIEWKMSESLMMRGQVGISKEFNEKHYFLPGAHPDFDYSNYGFFEKGSYDYTEGEALNIDANMTLSYSKTFADKHHIYAGLQGSIIKNNTSSRSYKTVGFVNPSFTDFTNGLSYKDGSIPVGVDNIVNSVGLTANINYTYDSRLFVDCSYRIDGSSQFGHDDRFAPFWSLGVGWNLHNEKLIEKLSFISLLRLRLSTGESGSMQFAPYQANKMYQFTNDSRYLFWTSAGMMGLGNPELSWQTTKQHNLGFEMAFLNNRLNAGIDVYRKTTDDLLSTIEMRPSSGFDNYTANVGSTQNVGFEAKLGYYVIRNTSKGLMWNISANLAYTKNEIKSLSADIIEQSKENLEQTEYGTILFEGRPQNGIYAVRSLGIDPMSGRELFLNKDNQVTTTWLPKDRVYCGSAEPLYMGNIGSMLRYKDFTLNLSFAYHWGGYQYNQTLIDKVEVRTGFPSGANYGLAFNADKRVIEDRWQKPGDVTFFKGYCDESTKSSTRFVMKDNMFEFQSVSLQYRWHTQFVTQKLGAQAINWSVNMSNLFYFSSIKRERGTDYPFANNMQFQMSVIF